MKIKTNNRQFLSAAVILFYLLPLLFFATYSIGLMSLNKSWTILSFGLLLISLGSLTLILLIYYWETALKQQQQEELDSRSRQITFYSADKEPKVTSLDASLLFNHIPVPPIEIDPSLAKENVKELNLLQTALAESQTQHSHLTEEIELKIQELKAIEEENEKLVKKAEQVAQDFADYKLFSEEQLRQKNLQMTTLQQMLEDQRTEMEKRQDQIYQLDTKVHDLSYEIKTLLYLNEAESPSSSPSQKKC